MVTHRPGRSWIQAVPLHPQSENTGVQASGRPSGVGGTCPGSVVKHPCVVSPPGPRLLAHWLCPSPCRPATMLVCVCMLVPRAA